MKKKSLMVVVVMMLLLGTMSSVAFAAKYSNWIPARNYPDIYYQYVNQFNSNEWDGVRFANQNSHRVKIFVKFSYHGSNAGDRTVYLEGGNTYSEILQLGPGVEMSFRVERD